MFQGSCYSFGSNVFSGQYCTHLCVKEKELLQILEIESPPILIRVMSSATYEKYQLLMIKQRRMWCYHPDFREWDYIMPPALHLQVPGR